MYGYYVEKMVYRKGTKQEKTVKYKYKPFDNKAESYDTYDEALVVFNKATYHEEWLKEALNGDKAETKFFDMPERPEINEWYTNMESNPGYFQRISYRIRRVQRKKVK